MQLDALPSHVVVVGATNHPELLDRAVWRRFQVRLNLPSPTAARLVEWLAKFEKRIEHSLGFSHITLAKKLSKFNFAEVEEFGTSVFRKYVLALPDANMKRIVDATLKTWKSRSAKTLGEVGE
jgi:SpoVK/Ycf46/Vps4 family AAA+-type ATPase